MKVIPISVAKEDVTAYKIIANKIIEHAEIVVNFFDYCKLISREAPPTVKTALLSQVPSP